MTAPEGDVVLVPPPDQPAVRENLFPDAGSWFQLYFSKLWARPGGYNWCHQWPEHQEARTVITLLWETWELAMADGQPNTMTVWLRDFAYNLMEKLTADGGCFTGCDWNDDPPHHTPECKPLT